MSQDTLRITGITTGFGGRNVIDNLSLDTLLPGTTLSLIGPNAVGKTTLLRAVAGLQPATGSVKLGESELLGVSLAEHARFITYMPQSLPQRVALTVLETVLSALRASPMSGPLLSDADILERAMDVIGRVGITGIAMRGLDSLSGGQRQLASLAQALVRQPRILLLDEPISALDLNYQLRVMKLVRELSRERGMIAIMVLHDLTIAARWSDRVVVLSKDGVAASGVPAEAITPKVLADVYQVSARVEQRAEGLNIIVDDVL